MLTVIARPNVNWHQFVTNASRALNISPTRALDDINIPSGSPLSYLLALGQIEYPGTPPLMFLKSKISERVMDHLQYSFFFELTAEVLLEIIKMDGIKVNSVFRHPNDEVGIMSGTLLQFRNLIINGMAKENTIMMRDFLAELFSFFIDEGFRDVFSGWVPKRAPDSSLYLEYSS